MWDHNLLLSLYRKHEIGQKYKVEFSTFVIDFGAAIAKMDRTDRTIGTVINKLLENYQKSKPNIK